MSKREKCLREFGGSALFPAMKTLLSIIKFAFGATVQVEITYRLVFMAMVVIDSPADPGTWIAIASFVFMPIPYSFFALPFPLFFFIPFCVFYAYFCLRKSLLKTVRPGSIFMLDFLGYSAIYFALSVLVTILAFSVAALAVAPIASIAGGSILAFLNFLFRRARKMWRELK